MVNVSSTISIVAILGIVIALYLIFRNFDYGKVFGSIGGAGNNLSGGISDFFDNLGSSSSKNTDNGITPVVEDQTNAEQIELFGRTLTNDEEKDITDIQQAMKSGDKKVISDIVISQKGSDTKLSDYNPKGIFGYGILGSGKQGIPTELAKELGIFDFTTSQVNEDLISRIRDAQGGSKNNLLDNVVETLSDTVESIIPKIPNAYGDDTTQSSTRNKDEIIADAKSRYKQRQTNKKLKKDDNNDKKPLHSYLKSGGSVFLQKGATTSQRANRIFTETGLTRDELISGKTKKTTFNFGTNTGSGSKTSTKNTGGERGISKKGDRRKRMEEEAERARQHFKSERISNF